MTVKRQKIALEKADAIFISDLSHKELADLPRFQMYQTQCRAMGMSLAVLSMADDIVAQKEYRSSAAQRWARNLQLYDRLCANDSALMICHRAGAHALGALLTMAWRPNKWLLDYDCSDIGDGDSGYPEIESYFPSLAGENMLGSIARHGAYAIGASKPLYDILIDDTKYAALLPTGFPVSLFKERDTTLSDAAVKLVWLGSVDTIEEAKEALLAIDTLSHLPVENQARIELHLIGKGTLWEETQKHIEPTSFGVHFHHRGSDEALADFLLRMDIGLCLPANTAENKTKDARDVIALLMAGIPVCTLKQAEAGRLIKDGETGFVVESIDKLSEAVQQLLDDKKYRLSMGKQAAQQAKADFAYGEPDCPLGKIISFAWKDGDRSDWWLSGESHPHLFPLPRQAAVTIGKYGNAKAG